MKSISSSALRLSSCTLLVIAAAGCGGGESEPADVDQPAANAETLGEYVIHVQPRLGKLTMRRLSQAALDAEASWKGPGLSPQALIDANIVEDGNTGTGPASSVELVTNQATIVDT